MSNQFEIIINDIKSNKNILINELIKYGSSKAKAKGKYSCIHCTSSDALSIKENSEGYIYKCFSCGEYGTVFDVSMKKEGIDFKEALKNICLENNIQLPNKEYTQEQKIQFEKIQAEKIQLDKFKASKEEYLNNLQKLAYENKNIDEAFKIECIKDNLVDIKHSEYINHTKYKADKVYYIDKYISEEIEGLKIALNEANNGKKVLLISPTGSGKTDTTIKEIKPNELYKATFISPNASNVEQIMNKYKIEGAYGTDLNGDIALKGNNIACMTWDKFSQLEETDLSKFVAVVDEVHQTFTDMYRKDKIKGLYRNIAKCKGQIDITATPNKLDIKSYDYIVEYKQKIQTDYNVFLYNNINDTKVLELINNSKKFALLENNINNLEYYQQSTDKITDILTSGKKEASKTYDNIMINENIGNYDGILNTSVIVAGVNIYDEDITDIIVIGEKDIATVRQYVARFRDLPQVNVHIFNTYKEFSNTYNLEWLVNEKLEELQKALDGINYFNKAQYQECTLSLKAIKLEENNHIYYDENSNEYKINIQSVRHEVYTNYFNKADIVSYKALLEEYFNNITIVNIDEDKSKAKKSFKEFIKCNEAEAKEKLKEHKDILVGATDILKSKVPSNLNKYLVENNISEAMILEQYKENNIADLLKVGKNKNFIDLYSKYVTENNFTYDLAWNIAELTPKKRKHLFNSLNKIVFRMIKENYPHLINEHLLENKIYNYIIKEFVIGTSYTNEHIDYFIEVLNLIFPGIKISNQKVLEVIKENYVVEEIKTTKWTHLSINFYNNILPKCVQNKKQARFYTIQAEKNVEDIIQEHGLSELDFKILNNIVDKRYKHYIDSKEAKELIEVNNIFAS